MDQQSFIRFQNVQKSFGALTVLQDFNLEIQRGEKVALIGPSGSGKSTILRILMTLEPISDGFVEIDGQPLWHERKGDRLIPASERHLREMRKRLGMVFQQFNLFPHMTALGNVMAPQIHVLGRKKADARSRAAELLERVGLADRMENRPSELSGGQQQRIAIARALALEPDIMLFDEPTSALDPEVVGDVLEVMRALATETELTMLIVTHQMGFASEICDRVCFFDAGALVEEGTPTAMLRAPTEERTRRFLSAVLSH